MILLQCYDSNILLLIISEIKIEKQNDHLYSTIYFALVSVSLHFEVSIIQNNHNYMHYAI